MAGVCSRRSVSADLVERLRAQLRKDPSDSEIAFLLSLAVREPFVLYAGERARLRRVPSDTRSARELLMADAARQLLARTPTPAGGLRRGPPAVRRIGTLEFRGYRSRELEAEMMPSDEGVVVAASFSVPDDLTTSAWQERVITHEGDAIFAEAGGERWRVRRARVVRIEGERLLIASREAPEAL